MRLIIRVGAGAALASVAAVAVWWWTIGGTWATVETPSMGRAAPVGTLLWLQPATIADLHPGDIVTVRSNPPAPAHSRTYTHRVAAVNADGTVQTKGDLNDLPDPWPTDQSRLVGRVAARWVGVGWLVKALPMLILGGLAWWVLTALLASPRSRVPLRVVGAAALVAGALYVHQPLFGAWQLSFVTLDPSRAEATYVGTGLLPMQLQADAVPPVEVPLGEIRSIVVPHPDDTGRFHVEVVPVLPWQLWAVVAGACLLPAVWSTVTGTRTIHAAGEHAQHAADEEEPEAAERQRDGVDAGDGQHAPAGTEPVASGEGALRR